MPQPISDTVVELAGTTVLHCAPDGPKLDGEQAAADLVGAALSAGADCVAVPVARLAPEFLTLSSRLAGAALQKFVNYGIRIAIIGDIAGRLAESGALRDFVYESNRGRQVWFAPDLTALEQRLSMGRPATAPPAASP